MTQTDPAMIRVICLLIWCVAMTSARPNPRFGGTPKRKIPLPGSGFRSREPETNLTMDQIITQQLGGISDIGNKLMDADGLILAELDLRLTPEQYEAFYNTDSNGQGGGSGGRSKRKATTNPVLKWFHGEIPYTFAQNTFNAKETVMIKEAMTEWERYTCLNFVAATPSHPNVVDFVNGDSCSSQLGMVGGRQMLMLQSPGCRYRGLYLHEIAHAIGLIHEHQRPDRDGYVDIFLQNVHPQLHYSFTKRTKNTGVYNTTYEYSSVMHYGVTAFSIDGRQKTILPKDRSREEEIGKVFLKELSFNDILAVNNMYKCAGICPDTVKCKDGGFVDETCRCMCPDGTRDCEEGYSAPATNGECSNKHDDWQCTIWANSGECTRNSKFMSASCRKACQLCSYTVAPSERVGCKDVHPKKCAKWKENGDCVANEWWMSLNCRKTCNACVDKSQRKETQCENKHSDSAKCDTWAADGECKINPFWMLISCRKSCQTCDQTPPEDICTDLHSNKQQCVDWAQSGECQANPSWMLLNCKKSCDVCGGGPVVTKAPVKCVETNPECPAWAESGECLKNPSWMLTNCPVSCDVCVPDSASTPDPVSPDITHPTVGPQVPCNNLHDDSECGVWASTGHCEINPSWMHHNCRKACRLCVEVKVTLSPPVKPDCTCQNSGSRVLGPATITLLILFALLVALTSRQQ